jgi:hypothetical protein
MLLFGRLIRIESKRVVDRIGRVVVDDDGCSDDEEADCIVEMARENDSCVKRRNFE